MFTSRATTVLTSTTSSQTVTVPTGEPTMIVHNAASNPVYLKWGASVAVPTTFASGDWTMAVPAGLSRSFDIPQAGGTLAYIASTAGGSLIISIGSGDL